MFELNLEALSSLSISDLISLINYFHAEDLPHWSEIKVLQGELDKRLDNIFVR